MDDIEFLFEDLNQEDQQNINRLLLDNSVNAAYVPNF